MTGLLESTLIQGFALSLLVLGLAISFRFLDFPDLTVDGAFVLGAATGARLISAGWPASAAALCALFTGFVAGCCTGILHTKFQISKLLSGILMMIILYSVNFRVMGTSNLPLLQHATLPDFFRELVGGDFGVILFFGLCAFGLKFVVDGLLKSEWGTVLRTVGDNENLVQSLGYSKDRMKILGLGIANALVGLSGTLVSQHQGFADVNMGIGMIVVGVASLILGEAVVRVMPRVSGFRSLVEQRTASAIMGAVLYQLIVNVALRLGIAPTDLKMITAFLVIAAVVLGRLRGSAFAGIDRY